LVSKPIFRSLKRLTDAIRIGFRADNDTNVEIAIIGIYSGHSSESHSAAQTFPGNLSELSGVLFEVDEDREEISDLRIKSEKEK
jgi:hypothetical protein